MPLKPPRLPRRHRQASPTANDVGRRTALHTALSWATRLFAALMATTLLAHSGASWADTEPQVGRDQVALNTETTMDANAAREAVINGEIVLVDIRTPKEWEMTGIADVAEPLDMYDPAFIQKLSALVDANPGRQVAMICATGGRSGHVVNALRERGLTDIIDVSEGMMGSEAGPGWLARELPTKTAP
ncbi:MAG: rhodanese-like domain-containing protein [Pseudomonadota bacterium]